MKYKDDVEGFLPFLATSNIQTFEDSAIARIYFDLDKYDDEIDLIKMLSSTRKYSNFKRTIKHKINVQPK